MSPALDQHADREAGLLPRTAGVGYEPGVVVPVRILRGPRLPAHDEAGHVHPPARPAADDVHQPPLQQVPRRGAELHPPQGLRGFRLEHPSIRELQPLHEMGLPDGPPVGRRGDDGRHLDRRHQQLSLADREVGRVPVIPPLPPALPRPRSEEVPAALAGEVDAGLLAQVEALGVLLDHLPARAQPHAVEVHVARMGDPPQPIHAAVPLLLPALEGAGPDLEVARAIDPIRRAHAPSLEQSRAHHDLESGARGIHSGQDAVELRELAHPAPRLVPPRQQEDVRVEIGHRGEREDLAVARIEHDGAARLRGGVAQGLLHGPLDAGVDGEVDVPARLPGDLPQPLLQAAAGVDFHADLAADPPQLLLVALLDAGLADPGIHAVAQPFVLPPVALVHLPHEAQEMPGERPFGIEAPRLHDQVHPGVDGLQLGELEHRVQGQVFREVDGRLLLRGLAQSLEERLLVLMEFEGEALRQVLQVRRGLVLGRQVDQRERGAVGRDHFPAAVVDAAPRGGLGDDLRTVALGHPGVVDVAHHLDVEEPYPQHGRGAIACDP